MKKRQKCGLYDAINKEIDRLQDESNDFDENDFADQIDELYPEYCIAGMTISASRILKECDPIALREIALSLDDDRQSKLSQRINDLKYCLKQSENNNDGGCPFQDYISSYSLDDLSFDCHKCETSY